jgi:hypothetical protein
MKNGVTVTEDMVLATRVFVDLVRELWDLAKAHPDSRLWIERNFSLGALNPPAPMFGTGDVVIYNGFTRRLFVPDYKHGVGYAVTAKGNSQLWYYGLGALLDIEKEIGAGKVDFIEMAIVQPRAAHPEGTIRKDFATYAEMLEFAFVLIDAAHQAMTANAPRKPGPWCRWCKASAVCPEKKAQAQALAQIEFANAEAEPPAPASLPLETVLQILEHKDVLIKWLASIDAFVHGKLERGESVPGWKLVPRRAMRRWRDAQEVAQWLELGGYPPSEYKTEPELKSPAQIEKMMKTHGEKKPEIPEVYIIKESSGTTLAPEYDDRPAIAGGVNDFTVDVVPNT